MVISERIFRSTREAALELGIHHITLQRYVKAGKVPAPPIQTVGGVRVRLWSTEDIHKVRQVLPKIANGRRDKSKSEQKKK